MRFRGFQPLAVLIALSLVACGAAPGGGGPSLELVASAKARTEPTVPDADLKELVAGNTAFALDLYQAIREEGGNLFYSPHSISLALAMAFAGARSETAEQMADGLRYTLEGDLLHAAFNALDQYFSSLDEGGKGREEGGFRLSIANAIWGQKDYQFRQEFLDLLAENYGAGLRLLDFANDAEKARKVINDWVAEQTKQKILDLLPQGSLDPLTRLVLTNAVYFNAAWANPFDENGTQDGTFHLLDGNTVTVPMMRQMEHLGYTNGDGFTVVELPYKDGKMSMVILVPDDGEFQAFEESLDAERLDAILDDLESTNVTLTLPKFEFKAELQLGSTLREMGMPLPFTAGAADFSGMDGTRTLYIDEVYHKAFVSVNEAGTEAAAATAVVMRAGSMPAEPVQVTVDRPFIFLIRDLQTGAMLFVGRVLNPSA